MTFLQKSRGFTADNSARKHDFFKEKVESYNLKFKHDTDSRKHNKSPKELLLRIAFPVN